MKKTVVIYDDTCPFCRAQLRLLKRLDWLHALAPLPASDPRALAAAPGLTREALFGALHCVTPRGRVLAAARAFRHLFSRLPPLMALALLLWVPGVIHAAEWVYRRVARNRWVLGRVCGCGRG